MRVGERRAGGDRRGSACGSDRGGCGIRRAMETPPSDDTVRAEDAERELVAAVVGRLAFERRCVEAYEALLEKHRRGGAFEGGPTRSELELLRDEKLRQAHLAREVAEMAGVPETAATQPGGGLGSGLATMAAAPDVAVAAALEALLFAESADRSSWTAIAALARSAGRHDMAPCFEAAAAEDARHVERALRWLRRCSSAA
jgi:hypothetical protein